ncbi:hypothetical protein LPJ71_004362, partial [Coemansia sp. S17]
EKQPFGHRPHGPRLRGPQPSRPQPTAQGAAPRLTTAEHISAEQSSNNAHFSEVGHCFSRLQVCDLQLDSSRLGVFPTERTSTWLTIPMPITHGLAKSHSAALTEERTAMEHNN